MEFPMGELLVIASSSRSERNVSSTSRCRGSLAYPFPLKSDLAKRADRFTGPGHGPRNVSCTSSLIKSCGDDWMLHSIPKYHSTGVLSSRLHRWPVSRLATRAKSVLNQWLVDQYCRSVRDIKGRVPFSSQSLHSIHFVTIL
jgi:hypothetical protein